MLTLKEQLEVFIETDGRNKWIKGNKMEVYLRLGPRIILLDEGKSILRCLQIVNVNVDPDFQRKGRFKAFLEQAEDVCADCAVEAIYIENVINKFLHKFLERERYKPIEFGQLTSFYKPI